MGQKNASSSYYRFIDITDAEMTYTDLHYGKRDKIKSINFENYFYLSSECYDFALCMNTLEHIFNHQQFINNVSKSLRAGGILEGVVPFLYHYHADPDDYFRYTHTGLEKILVKAGFENIKLTKIGPGGFTVSANMLSQILKFKPLVLIWWLNAIILDAILNRVWSKNDIIYVGLAFSATKSNR